MKALPWPVGRYRRILPALTANQNAGFVTVPSENKIILHIKRKYFKLLFIIVQTNCALKKLFTMLILTS